MIAVKDLDGYPRFCYPSETMKPEFPLAEKSLPKNLPAKFQPVRWENFGSSIIGTASGRLVKFWPADRLIQSVPQ